MEVEVVLRPGQDVAEAERIADEFRHRLGVRSEELISGAYIDLMEPGASPDGSPATPPARLPQQPMRLRARDPTPE